MYLECKKRDLLKGIQIIETAVSTKATLPVLLNFLIQTEKNRIKLVSTDLEIAVKCYIDGKINTPGGITIKAKTFGNIIKEIPEQTIQIKTDDKNQVDVRAGKSHFVLPGEPEEDFPTLPEFPEEEAITIEGGLLREIIKKTIFAISTDETRYALTGLHFVVQDNKIKCVATDGRRLAYIGRPGATKKVDSQATIPGKTINELLKILSIEENCDVKISITKNQAGFSVKDITLISRLIDSSFPNFEQVIPKKTQTKIQVDAKKLLSCTKQISLLTQEKGGTVKYLFGGNTLRLSTQVQGLGSGEVEMDIPYDGAKIEMAFNPAYVMDILRNIAEEKVEFGINGVLDACTLKAVGDEGYLCVVMPMRL